MGHAEEVLSIRSSGARQLIEDLGSPLPGIHVLGSWL